MQSRLNFYDKVVKQSGTSCPLAHVHAGRHVSNRTGRTICHSHSLPRAPSVGGFHGEGFTTLKLNGDVTYMDVDRMNEHLRFQGAQRLRNVQAPDQAYGMVFALDNLVADVRGAMATAWQALAADKGLRCPSNPHHLVQHNSPPQRIITDVLCWTRDPKEVDGLVWDLNVHFSKALLEHVKPAPGIREWLDLAGSYQVPCVAITSLDRHMAQRVLERATLHDYFSCGLITAEDEYDTTAQALLAASLRLSRPPNHCLLFDDNQHGITAAHNVSMKAVAVARPGGHSAGWQLRSADVTVTSFSQLSLYNVRRLFANTGYEVGDLCKEVSGKKPNKPRVRNAIADAEPSR